MEVEKYLKKRFDGFKIVHRAAKKLLELWKAIQNKFGHWYRGRGRIAFPKETRNVRQNVFQVVIVTREAMASDDGPQHVHNGHVAHTFEIHYAIGIRASGLFHCLDQIVNFVC